MGLEVFSKNIQFEVGVRNKVKFWIDRWCRDLPFHVTFSVVYWIATNREASMDSSLERLGWRNGEVGMLVSFENQMIGRWVLWMNSFVLWDLI